MWHLTLSKILHCELLIPNLRILELPRCPEHVQKANHHLTLPPPARQSHAVTSPGMPDQDQLQRGMACEVEVHEPVLDEFRQAICEDRRCRWIPYVEVTSVPVDFEFELDSWKQQLVS